MRFAQIAAAAVMLLLALANTRPAAAADAPADDRAKMVGTWTVVAADKGGNPAPPEVTAKMSVVITAAEITIKDGDRAEPATIVATDPTQKPATIDLGAAKQQGEPPVLGIYKLDGDTLTICFRKGGGPRPTEFKAGDGVALLELARKK